MPIKHRLAANSTWYHGGAENLRLTNRPLFVTKFKEVAEAYARGEVFGAGSRGHVPTLYEIAVLSHKIVDFRTQDFRDLYVERRPAFNASRKDRDEEMPKLTSIGFISSHTGLPSYGLLRGLSQMFADHDGIYIDESSQGWSLALFNPQHSARILSSRSL